MGKLPCSTRRASLIKQPTNSRCNTRKGFSLCLSTELPSSKMGNSLMVFFRAGRLVRPFCNEREVAVRISCTGGRHLALNTCRLGGDRWLSGDHSRPGVVFQAAVGTEHGGLLRFRQKRLVVAGGNVDGGDHVCGRYAAGRDGTGLYQRSCGELAVVEFFSVGNDDGVCVGGIFAGRSH